MYFCTDKGNQHGGVWSGVGFDHSGELIAVIEVAIIGDLLMSHEGLVLFSCCLGVSRQNIKMLKLHKYMTVINT